MAKFDAKRWAGGAPGPVKKSSSIDLVPGLPEALAVIGREIASGRSSATYPAINKEVIKGEFGLEVSLGTVGDYMRKHMVEWHEQEEGEGLGSE